jgi:hypothetical protein
MGYLKNMSLRQHPKLLRIQLAMDAVSSRPGTGVFIFSACIVATRV